MRERKRGRKPDAFDYILRTLYVVGGWMGGWLVIVRAAHRGAFGMSDFIDFPIKLLLPPPENE